MCGISGIWNLNKRPVEKTVAEKFNNAIAHRGPDDHGVYIDENAGVALGHRRLSIIDLSFAGHQPMFSADKNLVLTYNGEIYNYLELKKELIAKGYSFKSNTDSEVVLVSYQEWGVDCLKKFNGMWAFAIWDQTKKSLFLSRDRFGIKPLYYVHQQNNLFAFASESVAFNSLEGFEKIVNRKNINYGIRDPFYLEAIGETIYNDIVKLKPGHYLIIDHSGKLQIQKYWYTEDNLIDVPKTYNEQVEYFKYLFTDACRLRLRSDVPIGIALSGGLDSSSVYSTVKELYKANTNNLALDGQTAFIATFPGSKTDEKRFADKVVEFHKGTSKYIYPVEDEICNAILTQTKLEDFIYLSPPVVHNIYKEMKVNDIRVSLDGHGADEMLFGYPDMVAEWLRTDTSETNYEDLLQAWKNMEGVSEQQAKKYFSPKIVEEDTSILKKVYSKYIPKRIKSFYRKQVFNINKDSSWLLDFNEFPNHNGELNFLNSYLTSFSIPYKKFHGGMMLTILRNWDRASMRHAVEIRMPFMDWRLVSYVFSLPAHAKVNNGYSKNIVRDSMKGIMPESIRLRKNKVSINAPMQEWFNGPMSNFILDAVHSQTFLQSDIWNGKILRDYAVKMTISKKWTQNECNSFWPYLNAWILIN